MDSLRRLLYLIFRWVACCMPRNPVFRRKTGPRGEILQLYSSEGAPVLLIFTAKPDTHTHVGYLWAPLHCLQRALIHCVSAHLVAVRQVTTLNKVKHTAGFDSRVANISQSTLRLAQYLI